jgi:hypothetical protein
VVRKRPLARPGKLGVSSLPDQRCDVVDRKIQIRPHRQIETAESGFLDSKATRCPEKSRAWTIGSLSGTIEIRAADLGVDLRISIKSKTV